MARTPGSRNADFEETREQLLLAVRRALSGPDGTDVSFRQIAAEVGVSVPTLRHYFGDRVGVIRAVLESAGRMGAPHLARAQARPPGTLEASVRELLAYTAMGFQQGGLAKLHTIGIGNGMGHVSLGPAYLEQILEPSLQAIEARLARHAEAGELRPGVNLRHAAIGLASPVLLMLIHQHELGGRELRPLDVDAFLDDQASAFVRAYGAPGQP